MHNVSGKTFSHLPQKEREHHTSPSSPRQAHAQVPVNYLRLAARRNKLTSCRHVPRTSDNHACNTPVSTRQNVTTTGNTMIQGNRARTRKLPGGANYKHGGQIIVAASIAFPREGRTWKHMYTRNATKAARQTKGCPRPSLTLRVYNHYTAAEKRPL